MKFSGKICSQVLEEHGNTVEQIKVITLKVDSFRDGSDYWAGAGYSSG